MSEIENPFDGEVARYTQKDGATKQQARDFVVLRYLMAGDTRALAYLLQGNYMPGKAVRTLLSLMLQPEVQDTEDPETINSIDREGIPYELVAKKRDGTAGRKSDPVVAEKNQALADQYYKRKNETGSGTSDSVIAKMVEDFGPEISESMIREATKVRSPKSGQGKK